MNVVGPTWRDQFATSATTRSLLDLIEATGDIVLCIDEHGIVRDMTIGSNDLASDIGSEWLDKPLLETVTRESRDKVKAMLVGEPGTVVRREINHALTSGDVLPIRYSAMRLAPDGLVAIVGRDLRELARLQKQLLDATVAVEHDYALQRAVEVQFRALFQNTSDPILIVEAAGRRIVEANASAEVLFNRSARHLVGSTVDTLFADHAGSALQEGFAAVRSLGQTSWAGLELRNRAASIAIAGWLVRSAATPMVLLRLAAGPPGAKVPDGALGPHWEALRHLPEALVATDAALIVTDVNEAFLDMVGLPGVTQAKGEALSRFLGPRSLDLDALAARVGAGEAVRRYGAVLQGWHGVVTPVELSAAAIKNDKSQTFCFLFRPQVAAVTGNGAAPLKPASEIRDLVGRMPLREIVRETADVIEELCIEAALDLTNDNRASAADMLGLSRQSLYAKLRRHNLGDLPGSGDDQEQN